MADFALPFGQTQFRAQQKKLLKRSPFSRFAFDYSLPLMFSEQMRRRFAQRRGLDSTNVTGGLSNKPAGGIKPTLFTLT